MPHGPTAVYANVVNIRLTGKELILEFAAHFPDKAGERPPTDLQPVARIVLPSTALSGLVNVLQQTFAEQQKRAASQSPPAKVQ